MNDAKRRKLKAKGWRVGDAQQFLGLSDQEAAFIELKLKLAQSLRAKRQKKGMGQIPFAKTIRSSQSRVAKMEAADSSVSVDLLVRSHLALGTSVAELGRIISGPLAGTLDKSPDLSSRRGFARKGSGRAGLPPKPR